MMRNVLSASWQEQAKVAETVVVVRSGPAHRGASSTRSDVCLSCVCYQGWVYALLAAVGSTITVISDRRGIFSLKMLTRFSHKSPNPGRQWSRPAQTFIYTTPHTQATKSTLQQKLSNQILLLLLQKHA